MSYGKKKWKRFTTKGGDPERTRTLSSITLRDGKQKRG